MRRHVLVALGAAALLAGCSSIGALSGAVVGAASGTASANPAVGIAVGIAVQAGVDESINAVFRYWSRQEQAAIAGLVGSMAVGQRQAWAVRHAIPYGNEQGEVTVVRDYATPLAACREAVFSVEDSGAKTGPAPHFTTTVCRDGGKAGGGEWQWALAEPAVARWGALQ